MLCNYSICIIIKVQEMPYGCQRKNYISRIKCKYHRNIAVFIFNMYKFQNIACCNMFYKQKWKVLKPCWQAIRQITSPNRQNNYKGVNEVINRLNCNICDKSHVSVSVSLGTWIVICLGLSFKDYGS